VVTSFLASYQRHDYLSMQALLDPAVEFRDLAFESITGADVGAMWRWYCEPTSTRKDPIEVPGFDIVTTDGDRVCAEYWVRYSPARDKLVNYVVRSEFTLSNGRILRQVDHPVISVFEFARMAAGFPGCLLALTPAFKPAIRKKMRKKLDAFKAQSGASAARNAGARG
jgi:hypothetical protein